MTYDEQDISIDSGEPIELYEFLRTDLWSARYTTGQQQITEGDWTYKPAPIKRSKLRQGDNALKDAVTLTLPGGTNWL